MDKKVRNVKIITIISIVLIFICTIILAIQLVKINNLKEQSKNLEVYKEQLIDDINNYSASNNYYENNRDEYQEKYAREELGWGEKDEKWYVKK